MPDDAGDPARDVAAHADRGGVGGVDVDAERGALVAPRIGGGRVALCGLGVELAQLGDVREAEGRGALGAGGPGAQVDRAVVDAERPRLDRLPLRGAGALARRGLIADAEHLTTACMEDGAEDLRIDARAERQRKGQRALRWELSGGGALADALVEISDELREALEETAVGVGLEDRERDEGSEDVVGHGGGEGEGGRGVEVPAAGAAVVADSGGVVGAQAVEGTLDRGEGRARGADELEEIGAGEAVRGRGGAVIIDRDEEGRRCGGGGGAGHGMGEGSGKTR